MVERRLELDALMTRLGERIVDEEVKQRLCDALKIRRHFFREVPKGHFYPPNGSGFALIDRTTLEQRYPAAEETLRTSTLTSRPA